MKDSVAHFYGRAAGCLSYRHSRILSLSDDCHELGGRRVSRLSSSVPLLHYTSERPTKPGFWEHSASSSWEKKNSKTQSSLNFLQSGPRKFTKSDFSGLALIRRVWILLQQPKQKEKQSKAPPQRPHPWRCPRPKAIKGGKNQALTKGQFAPGVASAFACVLLLGGLGRGRRRGVGGWALWN